MRRRAYAQLVALGVIAASVAVHAGTDKTVPDGGADGPGSSCITPTGERAMFCDAGTPEQDAGSGSDAGVPRMDGGNEGSDAGVPPPDAGGSGSGVGVLAVAPATLSFVQPVLTSGQMTVTITNLSADAALTGVAVAIDDTVDYTLLGCGDPCGFATIAAGGSAEVEVSFTPTTGGQLPVAQLTVTADGMMAQVAVDGFGSGTEVLLVSPLTGELNFGSIGLGSSSAQTIQIFGSGNLATDTEVVLTGDPIFSLSQPDIALANNPGSAGAVTVTCGSSAPGTGSGTVTLTTATVYAGSSYAISLACVIADTDVTATPSTIAVGDPVFGELRRDAGIAPVVTTITLVNRGTATAAIGTVAIAASGSPSAPTHASVSAQPTSASLAANATTTLQVTVDPNALSGGQSFDEDFAARQVVVAIPVDNTMLTVPVIGKVVVAQTSLTPPATTTLDLGTVCLGGTGSATVVLTDTGTAHVLAMAASIGAGFAVAGAGSDELAPGSGGLGASETATVTSVATATAGTGSGVLMWSTDVPAGSGNYALPVTVVVASSGLGVSPGSLTFPLQSRGIISTAQTINVQNCDSGTETATIGSLVHHVGAPDAWGLSAMGSYTLPPGRSFPIAVTFSPAFGGYYYAELPITSGSGGSDSTTTVVALYGTASGPTAAATDFYACGCHGPGVPVQGWPVGVAIVVVVGLRRRATRARAAR